MTTPHLPDADDYWGEIIARAGVGREGHAFFGDRFIRITSRRLDTIAGSGVLESLIGGSSSLGVELWGRRHKQGARPEWFHLDISPAFNTWETDYEHSPPDANHGSDGLVTGSARSSGPMPRAHIQHPSSLIYYERFPIWGGISHNDDDYLPGTVDVLWQESAAASSDEPDWQASPTPGALARINLVNAAHPDSDGTAIFDLNHRVCLYFEIRHLGEPSYGLVVDAMKERGSRKPLTDFGRK